MMRSLYSGVSGLRNMQTQMDVIGNNIANVNTIGYKASTVNFQDILSQTLEAASGGTGNQGGTNAMQVGLGVGISSISTDFSDGSYQSSNNPTDLAISGQGFFIVQNGANQAYTRAGNFTFDNQGNYLDSVGDKVMGWLADSSGNINSSSALTPIQIPVGMTMPAKATQSINYTSGANLSSSAAVGSTAQGSTNIYDSLGASHNVTQTFTKVGDNTWLVNTTAADGSLTGGLEQVTFNADGSLKNVNDVSASTTSSVTISSLTMDSAANSTDSTNITVFDSNHNPHVLQVSFTANSSSPADSWDYTIKDLSNSGATLSSGSVTWDSGTSTYTGLPTSVTLGSQSISLSVATPGAPSTFKAIPPSTYSVNPTASSMAFTPSGGASAQTISMDLSALTQYSGDSTLTALDQDGYTSGTLQSKSIDSTGTIVGSFSNGKTMDLAQVALATFNNPGGLTKSGDSLYLQSTNSGLPQVGAANTGGRGVINPGELEASNVDLSTELSDMIITQRAFEANSKIITTSDDMLQDLNNLKR